MNENKNKYLFKNTYEFFKDEKVLEEIEELAALGFSQTQIAQYFGIKPEKWYKLIKKHPSVIDRMAVGELKTLKIATGKLQDLIRKENVTAVMYYLKTHGGPKWRDQNRAVEEVEEKKARPNLTIKVTDPVEAARVYQEIMQGD